MILRYVTQTNPGLYSATSGADLGFLERGFICVKMWGLALLVLSRFS